VNDTDSYSLKRSISFNSVKNWYAIYVQPRAEKKVSQALEGKGLEHYLPLRKSLHQWSDRKKWVEIPVISGYIFVNISPNERMDVLKTGFVHSYVRYLGQDAIIPEKQINAMKCALGNTDLTVNIDSNDYKTDQPVRVVKGPLAGLTGNLVSIKNRKKFIILLEQIRMNIVIEIPVSQIEIIKKTNTPDYIKIRHFNKQNVLI
jgi:transcription antitermination factor NusG